MDSYKVIARGNIQAIGVCTVVWTTILVVSFIQEGFEIFSFNLFVEKSMYYKIIGVSAYLIFLYTIAYISFFLLVNLIYRNKLIRLENKNIFVFHARALSLRDLSSADVSFSSYPRKITFVFPSGRTKSYNIVFARETDLEIGKRLAGMTESPQSRPERTNAKIPDNRGSSDCR